MPSPITTAQVTDWNSTASPHATASFNADAGTKLLVFWMAENGGNSGAPNVSITNSGTVLSWGSPIINRPVTKGTGQGWLVAWSATVDTNRTGMTVSVSYSNTGTVLANGLLVFVWDANATFGTPATTDNGTGSGQPSLSVTTDNDNDAICGANVDWNATTGARTYRQVNSANPTEDAYGGTAGGNYIIEVFHYTDAGAAGAKTVGLTAPSTQRYVIGAVGVHIAGAAPNEGSASGAVGWAGSATGARMSAGSATGAVGWAGSATGSNFGPVLNLTVTIVDAFELALDWDDLPSAVYYDVERDGVIVQRVAVSNWNDTGRTPATEYCYRVRGVK